MSSDRENFRDDVKARVNLADWFIRDGVKLAGGPTEFKGLCPFHVEQNPSFSVFHKDGHWGYFCFACNAGGDVFSWVMFKQSLDFARALKHVANEIGMSIPEPVYQPQSVREAAASARLPSPSASKEFVPLDPSGKVGRYLAEQRLIPLEILTAYSVGQTVDDEACAFAYKWQPEGARGPLWEFCKVVKVDREDGKKKEWRSPKGGRNILFGMLAVPSDATELVIAEGEIDAMSWAHFGFSAVSVPGGASYLGWIEICWDWLSRFKTIHISFDEDKAGRARVVEVVKRLGMHRTDMVRLPANGDGVRLKDANECLQAGIPRETMAATLAPGAVESLRPEHLKNIYDFEDEIWSKFHPEGKEQLGLVLPWGNRNNSSLPFRVRYGEVTVWTGYNKHGKSEVLNHVMVDLCWQGEKALICSLEIPAPETYRKLIRMVMGRRDVCPKEERHAFRERCLTPLAERIWVYDHVGTANLTEVFNVMLYAFQRYGCRQFTLDSFMRFEGLDGEGQDIWNRQKSFMDKLSQFAALYRVHVHLVAHSKKPSKGGEGAIPRRYDVMGSSYISNVPNNVIVVWRNRAKQDALEVIFQACEAIWCNKYPENEFPNKKMPTFARLQGAMPPETNVVLTNIWNEMQDVVKALPAEQGKEFLAKVALHDSYFIVDAQRGGDGDCPARHLWFHVDSLQFIEASPWHVADARSRPKVYSVTAPPSEEEEML